MGKLLNLIRKFETLNIDKVREDSLREVEPDIIISQREQLLEGKTSKGEDLTPSYFDDPYFKTPESAKRYSDWKDRITPHPLRKSGTPNLFITGVYHSSIDIESFRIQGTGDLAEKIRAKYPEALGLNPDHLRVLIKEKLRPASMRNIRKHIRL